ncbi:PRC-barrel domain protein [Clostridium homopropionicum DSM 5847]|uniref:PRC-barrel domain protein n=1 Tax=Clostridium homopropionicum DSM 5847 TaxID=1121318 RepID=A0A0L6ZBW9_9CLOT|nr:PRC-barrel domain-containing protein [Clostridium homopropionicum]KOA20479.1 PRC-barrel domain protein [Clostridium homopropionicum DSM 5847]SFG36295.1 Uncharacterized protein YrrD, contains PRC-barrel domain [Clostridium homopropionicum]
MYRIKDFMLMDVINIERKRIGFIKDILISFNNRCLLGFCISPFRIFNKNLFVHIQDVITFNSSIVVKDTSIKQGLMISEIRGMDVVDINGDLLGMVEDFIFEKRDFKITGVVVSTGFIRNIIHGKKIFLIKDLILGEKNILYFSKNSKISFLTIPHELREVNKYE